MQDNNREMPKVDEELYYVIDEKNNHEVFVTLNPSFFRIPEKGFSTPKSKIDSSLFIWVLRNFKVWL